MCVLYAGPATLHEDKHVTETILKSWVTVATDVDAMTLGALKTYIKSRPSTVTNKFTIYFQPVCLWFRNSLQNFTVGLQPTTSRTITRLSEISWWRALALSKKCQIGVLHRMCMGTDCYTVRVNVYRPG